MEKFVLQELIQLESNIITESTAYTIINASKLTANSWLLKEKAKCKTSKIPTACILNAKKKARRMMTQMMSASARANKSCDAACHKAIRAYIIHSAMN